MEDYDYDFDYRLSSPLAFDFDVAAVVEEIVLEKFHEKLEELEARMGGKVLRRRHKSAPGRASGLRDEDLSAIKLQEVHDGTPSNDRVPPEDPAPAVVFYERKETTTKYESKTCPSSPRIGLRAADAKPGEATAAKPEQSRVISKEVTREFESATLTLEALPQSIGLVEKKKPPLVTRDTASEYESIRIQESGHGKSTKRKSAGFAPLYATTAASVGAAPGAKTLLKSTGMGNTRRNRPPKLTKTPASISSGAGSVSDGDSLFLSRSPTPSPSPEPPPAPQELPLRPKLEEHQNTLHPKNWEEDDDDEGIVLEHKDVSSSPAPERELNLGRSAPDREEGPEKTRPRVEDEKIAPPSLAPASEKIQKEIQRMQQQTKEIDVALNAPEAGRSFARDSYHEALVLDAETPEEPLTNSSMEPKGDIEQDIAGGPSRITEDVQLKVAHEVQRQEEPEPDSQTSPKPRGTQTIEVKICMVKYTREETRIKETEKKEPIKIKANVQESESDDSDPKQTPPSATATPPPSETEDVPPPPGLEPATLHRRISTSKPYLPYVGSWADEVEEVFTKRQPMEPAAAPTSASPEAPESSSAPPVAETQTELGDPIEIEINTNALAESEPADDRNHGKDTPPSATATPPPSGDEGPPPLPPAMKAETLHRKLSTTPARPYVGSWADEVEDFFIEQKPTLKSVHSPVAPTGTAPEAPEPISVPPKPAAAKVEETPPVHEPRPLEKDTEEEDKVREKAPPTPPTSRAMNYAAAAAIINTICTAPLLENDIEAKDSKPAQVATGSSKTSPPPPPPKPKTKPTVAAAPKPAGPGGENTFANPMRTSKDARTAAPAMNVNPVNQTKKVTGKTPAPAPVLEHLPTPTTPTPSTSTSTSAPVTPKSKGGKKGKGKPSGANDNNSQEKAKTPKSTQGVATPNSSAPSSPKSSPAPVSKRQAKYKSKSGQKAKNGANSATEPKNNYWTDSFFIDETLLALEFGVCLIFILWSFTIGGELHWFGVVSLLLFVTWCLLAAKRIQDRLREVGLLYRPQSPNYRILQPLTWTIGLCRAARALQQAPQSVDPFEAASLTVYRRQLLEDAPVLVCRCCLQALITGVACWGYETGNMGVTGVCACVSGAAAARWGWLWMQARMERI